MCSLGSPEKDGFEIKNAFKVFSIKNNKITYQFELQVKHASHTTPTLTVNEKSCCTTTYLPYNNTKQAQTNLKPRRDKKQRHDPNNKPQL
jgi:hypothetical protein